MCIRDRVESAYNTLNEQTLSVDDFSDTHISGHIDVKQAGQLVPVSYTHLDVYKRQELSLVREDRDGRTSGVPVADQLHSRIAKFGTDKR